MNLIQKHTPDVTFEQPEKQWKATVFEPGNYSLFWLNGKKQIIKSNETAQVMPLTGSWEVNFDPEWGGPQTIVLDELKSWTEFSEDGIRYYSGAAIYRKNFDLRKKILPGKKAWLSLGNLHEMALVKLNGHQFNLNWVPPYEMDVTNYLKDGYNELEIEITNLWPNRLIGDEKLTEQKRFTKTNINKFEGPDAEKLLRESGLIGPVSLIFSKEINMQWK